MYESADVVPVLCAFLTVAAAVRFLYACGTWIDAEGRRAGSGS